MDKNIIEYSVVLVWPLSVSAQQTGQRVLEIKEVPPAKRINPEQIGSNLAKRPDSQGTTENWVIDSIRRQEQIAWEVRFLNGFIIGTDLQRIIFKISRSVSDDFENRIKLLGSVVRFFYQTYFKNNANAIGVNLRINKDVNNAFSFSKSFLKFPDNQNRIKRNDIDFVIDQEDDDCYSIINLSPENQNLIVINANLHRAGKHFENLISSNELLDIPTYCNKAVDFITDLLSDGHEE